MAPHRLAAALRRLRPGPTERAASLAFLLFTAIQVPYFVVRNTTVPGWPAKVPLSPLQVTAAAAAAAHPQLAPALETALLPGAWLRECAAPLLRCHLQQQGGDACARERRLLFDGERLRRRAQLKQLVALVGGGDLAGRGGPGGGAAARDLLAYGSAVVVASAALSAVATARLAVAGFVLIAAGVAAGGHEALPTALMVAFLVVYSAFGLGEGQQRRRAAAAAAAIGRGSGSAGSTAAAGAAAATQQRQQQAQRQQDRPRAQERRRRA